MPRSIFGAALLASACLAAVALPASAQAYESEGWRYHHRYVQYPRRVRHFCRYETGWRGRGSYLCGCAWRAGYGWAGDNAGDFEYRADHYRGYWEDGTGRRFYDRGGYSVGHFDDGR